MITIELVRAHTPEDYGHEEPCGICGEAFVVEVVRAEVSTDDRYDMGMACPACVALMGRYKPERFPTTEEYEAAKERFPAPIWGSAEAASRAWEEGAPYGRALEENRIERDVPAAPPAGRFGALGTERRELFGQILTHLDFVAMVDEEDHGGSATAEEIRETLIPFCELEGGISDELQWREWAERRSSSLGSARGPGVGEPKA